MEQIAHLSSRALLRISGEDRVDFLQNLITCEVAELDDHVANFGALLTPQGKILFDFLVYREGSSFLFDVDASAIDELVKRLTFYKLRAKIELEIDRRQVYAVWGAVSSSEAEHSGYTEFPDPRLPALGRRFFAETAQSNSTENDWHAHRIALGFPHSGLDFALGAVFPHDALMDQYDGSGVDFTKGCYVGQEVVSRMQHRGTARNRFVRVEGDQPISAQPGTQLIAGNKVLGTLGSTAGKSALALVRVDRAISAIEQATDIIVESATVQLSPPEFTHYDWRV